MTDKELAFQKELKELVAKYEAQYEWEYGFYEEDQDYQHISLKDGHCRWSIDDLFPERAKRGRKYT